MVKAINERVDGISDDQATVFTDAGFSVERVSERTVVYERPVSDDVKEASRVFTQRRQIGYMSKDIPGRKLK